MSLLGDSRCATSTAYIQYFAMWSLFWLLILSERHRHFQNVGLCIVKWNSHDQGKQQTAQPEQISSSKYKNEQRLPFPAAKCTAALERLAVQAISIRTSVKLISLLKLHRLHKVPEREQNRAEKLIIANIRKVFGKHS